MDILTAQYAEIKGARQALKTYCATMQAGDLTTPVAQFNNSSIMYLLLHTANTYLHWLQFFESQQPVNYFKEQEVNGLYELEEVHGQIDAVVHAFIAKHQGNYFLPITQKLRSRDMHITATPLQLFTHTITHEFHHKGQILSMSRLLGYIPADTDVIRF